MLIYLICNPIFMKRIVLIALLAAAIALSLVAGCTGTGDNTVTPTPTATTVATPVPTTVTQTVATPVPVQTLPPNRDVEIQVNKDPINYKITVLFRGGSGQPYITGVSVTATPPGGQPETKALEPRVGSEVTFPGTRNTETRVEITVALDNGQSYKVKDQMI